jgi:hypothetical protein
MHYKNGREAHNGDKVVLFPGYGLPIVGILYDAPAGNDYCNGHIAMTAQNDPYPNLKECLHLDDVLGALENPVAVPPTPEQKAHKLYETYCLAVGGKAFNGDPLPDWATFRSDPAKKLQSDAWVAAAKVA